MWMAAPVIAMVARGAMPPPNPANPSPFTLHDPVDVERRLRSAGFSSVRTGRVTFPMRYPSFDEYWAETMDLAAPLAGALAALPSPKVEAVRAVVLETLAQFIGADGQIEAPASAVVAVAVV
jgi:hypothetical protein